MKGSKVRMYWYSQILIFEEQRAIPKKIKSMLVNNGGHLGIVIEMFMNYTG